ncbi:MAG: hypothetical protein A3C06_03375 [Candidatus Taylorbacteria bacterium RIFCSPHIGHO2_02_FULL_46_13]|uniref:Uncharacterized protein n=1 Tax=Candidatus Taylorbacteria bacterium RIFCSPHIGHO2_02_FULL_46_13 TaxID=1802312 RepID=A0A1G2MU88_9BACT|nr:MAG: hypothetical protein A3C06_03375 [Candidatus Taylorbacteria bacterium RIFCSPHIGHO2_02_FULL_46_13]
MQSVAKRRDWSFHHNSPRVFEIQKKLVLKKSFVGEFIDKQGSYDALMGRLSYFWVDFVYVCVDLSFVIRCFYGGKTTYN